MQRIKLTRGKFALVDDKDYERINKHKWWFDTSTGYARRSVWGKPTVYMHREVLNTPKGKYTDHINHDKLDNRKVNLRVCSQSVNAHNSVKKKLAYSCFKGVTWNKNRNKWFAQITINYKHINLGYFIDEIRAYEAYINYKEEHVENCSI